MSVSDQIDISALQPHHSEHRFQKIFEATWGYQERYGKPLPFYSDKASVFMSNNEQTTGGGLPHQSEYKHYDSVWSGSTRGKNAHKGSFAASSGRVYRNQTHTGPLTSLWYMDPVNHPGPTGGVGDQVLNVTTLRYSAFEAG